MAHSWGPHTLQARGRRAAPISARTCRRTSRSRSAVRCTCPAIGSTSSRAGNSPSAALMYYNRIFPLPDLLGSGVYVGASAEVGRMSNRFDGLPTPGTLWSGSVFAGADTFLGPAYRRPRCGTRGELEPVPAARRAVTGRTAAVVSVGRRARKCAGISWRSFGRAFLAAGISRLADGTRPTSSRRRPPRRASSARWCWWTRRLPD